MQEHQVFSVQTGWEALSIEGPDAKDFLHRITSADFKRLKTSSFTPGTILNPNGKLVLYFKALMLEPDRYLMLVPSHTPGVSASEFAAEEFEKLHFRENFKIEPRKTALVYLRAIGQTPALDKLPAPFSECISALLKMQGDLVSARNKGDEFVACLNENRWSQPPLELDAGFVVSSGLLEKLKKGLADCGFKESANLEPYRIFAGDPAVPNELGTSTIPLEAFLDDAVHENKGCYPGQEVIERIRSMGQVPRTLVKLSGSNTPPKTLSTIKSSSGEDAGIITSVAQNPFNEGWIGLGFVKRVWAKPDTKFTVAADSAKPHPIEVVFRQ